MRGGLWQGKPAPHEALAHFRISKNFRWRYWQRWKPQWSEVPHTPVSCRLGLRISPGLAKRYRWYICGRNLCWAILSCFGKDGKSTIRNAPRTWIPTRCFQVGTPSNVKWPSRPSAVGAKEAIKSHSWLNFLRKRLFHNTLLGKITRCVLLNCSPLLAYLAMLSILQLSRTAQELRNTYHSQIK